MGFNTLAALICSISVVTSSARSLVITTAMVAIARHRHRHRRLAGPGIEATRPSRSRGGVGNSPSQQHSAQELRPGMHGSTSTIRKRL